MWLLDLGNTRLKLAWADTAGLGPVSALAHAEPDFEARLARLLASRPAAPACLASVAPAGVRLRLEAVLHSLGIAPRRAETRAECAGVRIAYADPARLGVDRFLGLLAAHRRGGDWLVASFGSALTLDLLDARGRHRGGLIGIAEQHQRAALIERFPALQRGPGEPAVAWATDTADAVAAGARRQALGFVMAAWDDACVELGHPPRLLLGGGDAVRYADALRRRLGAGVVLSEGLVLEGLAVFAGLA